MSGIASVCPGKLNADRMHYLAIYFRSQLQSTTLLLKWRNEQGKFLEVVLVKEHFYLEQDETSVWWGRVIR
jgi:hypothetical protein